MSDYQSPCQKIADIGGCALPTRHEGRCTPSQTVENSASAEVTEVAIKAETKKLKEELIQLAAVAVAWAESLP